MVTQLIIYAAKLRLAARMAEKWSLPALSSAIYLQLEAAGAAAPAANFTK